MNTSDFVRKASKLLKTVTVPNQIEFVQGLSHLSEKQVLIIKQALSCDDPARVINEYDQRMTSLIGSGFGIGLLLTRWLFVLNSLFLSYYSRFAPLNWRRGAYSLCQYVDIGGTFLLNFEKLEDF